ncbi:MAG: hypothetical protein HYX84_01000 [Chloroflexi bacterium]|nr:hypothetical protein [Chloroflexota bacterium]
MPKRKKRLIDMTTEELAKRVFPKKILEKLKEIAHEKDNKPDSKSTS